MRKVATRRLLVCLVISLSMIHSVDAAEMAMGFRVGEVTHDSVIVWTRITKHAERNWDGYRDPQKRVPKKDEYTPDPIKVADRDGATPGAPGQLRLTWSLAQDLSDDWSSEWVPVGPKTDFVHQFQVGDLRPATKYFLKIEARDSADSKTTATTTGSFATPADAGQWQDVSFGVVTGQSYWDLDHREGYHMYPAMQTLGLNFMVPTGDTVYLDSESPRARTVELARFHWQRMYSLPRHVEFHRHVPGYWEVDDHDTWANDCWSTMKAKWMNPLTFEEGFSIYREQVPMGDDLYRTIRWGKGLQVWVVEGRRYRSANTAKDGPDKTIWGKEQLAWLKRTIMESDADFRVLVSPTPIVGPDRDKGKNDNHANDSFAHEGDLFRSWTADSKLKNFYTCCGDRHWQYMSIDPKTGLREFSCGPASDKHAGGNPQQPDWQPFLRVKGGFLTVNVFQADGTPTVAFRHHDVYGKIVHEFTATSR